MDKKNSGKRYKLQTLLFISLISGLPASASQSDVVSTISSEMARFSEVATITKQNENYQPYIISVFQGKELERLGVSNLKEALGLVPGVDMATDNFNNQTPIFRGSNPLAYGQSKLLIDGTLVNNVFFDAYSEYLTMPVDMIKRIEVVRGPGSKTDGINAYAGSINVITYAEAFEGFEAKDKFVLKGGSYDYKMGGFVKTYKAGDFTLFTDFYYQEDDKKLPAGPDGVSQGSLDVKDEDGNIVIDNSGHFRSGDAPVWLKSYSLGLNLKYKDFSLKARTLDYTQGSAYGINFALPENNDRMKLPSYYLELGYDKQIDDIKISIKAGAKYDTFDSDAKLGPDGLQLSATFDEGAYGAHLAEQRTLYQSSYIRYSGVKDHTITAGYRIMREETIDMFSKLSNLATGEAELVDYTETYPFFDKDAERDTYIFSLQDEFYYNDALSFIYGFNYEKTSLKDAGFDPRVSMVYQHDAENIFKFIYSQSHRNASWQEMYTANNAARTGSTSLDPERVSAYEAAYIKKFTSDSYLQANLFYLMNKDQISNSTADPEFKNLVDTDIYGLELEYKGNLTPNDQLYVNYSYVEGEDNSGVSLSNVAHHLAKGYYIFNFNDSFSFSTIAKHVGAKRRVSGDDRDKVDAYTTLDASVRYENKRHEYSLTLSLKNIFDEDVRYPSQPNTYYEDYRQEGRNFLVAFTKEF